MTLDRAVLAFAGIVVLAGVALGYFVNPLWLWLTVVAGVNMFQSAFTGFSPAAILFKSFGLRPGEAFH